MRCSGELRKKPDTCQKAYRRRVITDLGLGLHFVARRPLAITVITMQFFALVLAFLGLASAFHVAPLAARRAPIAAVMGIEESATACLEEVRPAPSKDAFKLADQTTCS